MKHSVLALATIGLVTLASCSNEEVLPANEDNGLVTITASMPEGFATRADYGDGSQAKKLSYAVYEAGTDNVIFASDKAGAPAVTKLDEKNFKLQLPLASGRSYDFLFWADAETNSPYTFTSATKQVTISYENIEGNDESRDAFFEALKDVKVSKNATVTAELRRPFGQLNVVTSDYDAYKAIETSINPTATQVLGTTSVKVSNVYNTLNLYSGVASGAQEVEFVGVPEVARTMTIEGKTATYNYLAMNYVLTGSLIDTQTVQKAQKELKDVEIKINNAKNELVSEYKLTNVPFQRNYRTNIYGELLTNKVDVDIIVMPEFYDDHNFDAYYTEVSDAKAFNDAVKAGKPVRMMKDLTLPFNGEQNTYPAEVDLNGYTLYVNGQANVVGKLDLKNGSILCNDMGRNTLFGVGADNELVLTDIEFKNQSYAELPVGMLIRVYATEGAKGSVKLTNVKANIVSTGYGIAMQGNATTPTFTVTLNKCDISAGRAIYQQPNLAIKYNAFNSTLTNK